MRRVLAALACLPLAGSLLAQDDPARSAAAQAQLIRQQQSDAFSLQLQQSIQDFRAGPLAPAQRLQLDSLHRDQRLRQSDTFYRQQVQQSQTAVAPGPPGANEAQLMRLRQENAVEESLAREAAANAVEQGRTAAQPAPNAEPQVIWAPVLR